MKHRIRFRSVSSETLKKIHPLIAWTLLVSGGVIATVTVRPWLNTAAAGDGAALIAVAGILLMVVGGLMLATGWDASRPRTRIRLDWFLPVLRRRRVGDAAWGASGAGRAMRRLLPAFLFSNRDTKKRGAIRRALRRLGPTWLAAPVRRIVQSACFVTFLVLFFYVCWPYGARPEPAGQVSRGWRLSEVGQEDGSFQFTAASAPPWVRSAPEIHVVDESDGQVVAAMKVQSVDRGGVLLRPATPLADEQIDRLLVSSGPWSFNEKAPNTWPSHYADYLKKKEIVAAELFLTIDPLVSISTAIASRSWVGSLVGAATILMVCMLIPRGFCGYLCPLGTLIDLFDGTVGKRITRLRVSADGWWVHIKYYLLLATLISACFGVLISGYVAAIPVITRGMLFLGQPLQSGLLRGRHLIPPIGTGHVISIALFLGVLALGLLRPRFWCKYVCPTGATFSAGNLFRVTQRSVRSTCIDCNKCVAICPFDAIQPDFTTRVTDCTLCQTCGGVCPTQAITFVDRWDTVNLKATNRSPAGTTGLGRRGFLSLAVGATAAVAGGVGAALLTEASAAEGRRRNPRLPVRPPGSVPEPKFLELCIRCGECFKVCPNNVLQSEGFEQGLDGLWTPMVQANWAGCETSCNACGQVCPTGAIRALSMGEKKVARMGLAVVNEPTCLPFAGRQPCQLCVDECSAAGYHAIEFRQVGTETDDRGNPIEGTGLLAPIVIAEKCVGCGLCQARCFGINVKEKRLLDQSAVVVHAGQGRDDRLTRGSYIRLRQEEAAATAGKMKQDQGANDYFVPPSSAEPDAAIDDPFGVEGP